MTFYQRYDKIKVFGKKITYIWHILKQFLEIYEKF